jgi:uncharacterized coiled-coil protein SlyX
MARVFFYDRLSLQYPEFTDIRDRDGVVRPFKSTRALMDKVQGAHRSLKIGVPASHSGRITNGRVYPGFRLKNSIPTWTDGYARPYYDRHPSRGMLADLAQPKTLGRIVEAEYHHITYGDDWKNDYKTPGTGPGSGFTHLRALITDQDAIPMFLDQRILTVSTGHGSASMSCSVCGQDWVSDGVCDHKVGHQYDSENTSRLCYLIAGEMVADHLATADAPADKYAIISETELLDAQVIADTFMAESATVETVVVSGMALVDEMDIPAVLLTEDDARAVVDADPTARPTTVTKQLPDLSKNAYLRDKAFIIASMAEGGCLSEDGQKEFKNLLDAFYEIPLRERRSMVDNSQMAGRTGSLPISNELQIGIVLSLMADGYYTGPEDERWIEAQFRASQHSPEQNDDGGSPMGNQSADPKKDSAVAADAATIQNLNALLEARKKDLDDARAEIEALTSKNATLETSLTQSNQENKHLLADRILDLKERAGDNTVSKLSEEDRTKKIQELTDRGFDYLRPTVKDLTDEMAARSQTVPSQKPVESGTLMADATAQKPAVAEAPVPARSAADIIRAGFSPARKGE